MPTVIEDYDDGDDVIQVCSHLILSAANKAKDVSLQFFGLNATLIFSLITEWTVMQRESCPVVNASNHRLLT